MFKAITNLTKAAVSVALTPVTVVVDTVMLPVDAEVIGKSAYSRTGKLLKNAGKLTTAALKPDEEI